MNNYKIGFKIGKVYQWCERKGNDIYSVLSKVKEEIRREYGWKGGIVISLWN